MFCSWPYFFIIYILPIKSIIHKYPNINYHLYTDDLQIYGHFLVLVILVLFMYMFNFITDLTYWFSHNSISLNMTKTNTIIFSRPSSPLSITHPFLIFLPTYHSITTLGFTITSHLDYSPHINNMIRTTTYFLYNIRKSRYKLALP